MGFNGLSLLALILLTVLLCYLAAGPPRPPRQ